MNKHVVFYINSSPCILSRDIFNKTNCLFFVFYIQQIPSSSGWWSGERLDPADFIRSHRSQPYHSQHIAVRCRAVRISRPFSHVAHRGLSARCSEVRSIAQDIHVTWRRASVLLASHLHWSNARRCHTDSQAWDEGKICARSSVRKEQRFPKLWFWPPNVPRMIRKRPNSLIRRNCFTQFLLSILY